MWKAREDGYTIQVRYGKILFCGANGAGKTNFCNLLLKEEFNYKHISTEVANPQQATIAIKAQVSKHDNDSEVVFEKMDIDQEIFQLMSYLPKKYKNHKTKRILHNMTNKKPHHVINNMN